MKQGMRFLSKPRIFMNQMQWSPYHWFYLGIFFALGVAETFLGNHLLVYRNLVVLLTSITPIHESIAFSLIIAVKLTFMFFGFIALSYLVWFVGSLFGSQGSIRVLLRRFSIVLTVFLAGHICLGFPDSPMIVYAGFLFYAWGVILGYFSIREQFSLNVAEAVVLGFFTLFVITSTWHFSYSAFSSSVTQQMTDLAHKKMINSFSSLQKSR